MYYFVLDRSQFALKNLYNIRVPLNCANCWNFQIDKRNLDIAVVPRQTACSSTTF